MDEEKKEEEKHFTPSSSLIECTGCECGISRVISTTATVFIKKQPMTTVKDGLPTSFLPFPTCSFNATNTCTPVPIGEWENQDVLDKIAIERQTPIIEGNRIKCQAQLGIGTITISEKTDTPPPPENVVDKAQNKINKAANYVTKKVTEVAQATKDAIGGIAGDIKEAGGFLQNDSIQGTISGASDFVDDIDKKKAEVDVAIGNIDIRLQNLRLELTELITGERQELKKLMEVRDKKPKEEGTETEGESEQDEISYNQDFFDQTNQESANAFLDSANDDIDALKTSAEAGKTARSFEIKPSLEEDENGEEKSAPRYWTESDEEHKERQKNLEAQKKNTVTFPKNRFDQIQDNWKTEKETTIKGVEGNYKTANNTFKPHGVSLDNGNAEDKKEQLNALAAVVNIPGLLDKTNRNQLKNRILEKPEFGDTSIISEQPTQYSSQELDAFITEKRGELDAEVQAEIDEVLKEIGYLEAKQKYNQESKELQEDIDRSAAALDVLGDFGAFIDGIAAEKLEKLATKYKKVMDQLGKNMSGLNDSLRGVSFIKSGFKAGDVVTHAPDLPKEEEKEKEPEKETPPPVLPLPTTNSGAGGGGGETEEEPKETDECTFTKLTVIKNNTLEYVVIEKEEDEVILEQPIQDPITFVAGISKKTKQDFAIIIENLKRTPEHKKDQLFYKIDGKTKEIDFLDGNKVILNFDINYNKRFFEKPILLSNFMGLISDIRTTDYNIPIEICGFNKYIFLNVYPDAEWTFMFKLVANDPAVYRFTKAEQSTKVYEDKIAKASRIGNQRKQLNYGGKGAGATFEIVYGVEFNGGENVMNLSAGIHIESIYNNTQKIFSIINKLDEFANYLKGKHKNDNSTSLGNLSSSALIVDISPPSIAIAAKRKLQDDNTVLSNPNTNLNLLFEIQIKPLIALNILFDLVKTAEKRIPLINAISRILKKVTDKSVSDILVFEISGNASIGLVGKIDPDNNENSLSVPMSISLGVRVGLFIEGEVWGIELKAQAEGKLSGTFSGSLGINYSNGDVFSNGSLDFSGLVGDIIISGKAGIFSTEFDSGDIAIGKWDNPINFGPNKLT